MALSKSLIFILTVLAASNILFAQESSSEIPDSTDNEDERASSFPFGLPFNLPFNIPFFGGVGLPGINIGNFGLPNFFSNDSSRDAPVEASEDSEESQGDEHQGAEHQDRLFFGTYLSTCNYTATPGNSCAGCRLARTCLSSNVAILKRCHLFFPYCNNGRCSLFAGSACNSNSTG